MEKTCIQCGSMFASGRLGPSDWAKRRFCGKPCWYAWKTDQPSKAVMIPCRVCGAPTSYRASVTDHIGLVHCGSAQCREESKRQKNEAIRTTHLSDYASGKRAKLRDNWSKVPRVSAEELLLKSWFDERGWDAQYKCVPGGISSVKLPRCFWLDFALPDRRMYVEIDGSIHRLRKERDARKDKILSDRGWKGLRVPASLVRSDLTAAIKMIEAWTLTAG